MNTDIRHGPSGGVLWINAYAGDHHISLGGYCRYWIEDQQFGAYSCPEHTEFGSVSYLWTGSRFVREGKAPTFTTEIFEGEWLSDDEWERVQGER